MNLSLDKRKHFTPLNQKLKTLLLLNDIVKGFWTKIYLHMHTHTEVVDRNTNPRMKENQGALDE